MKVFYALFALQALGVHAFEGSEQNYKSCNANLGFCVPSSICSNLTVLSNGFGNLNTRLKFQEVDESEECHYLETCCDPKNIISQKESQRIIEDEINDNTMQQCIQQCKVSDKPNYTKLPLKISPSHEPLNGCGFRNRKGLGFEVVQQSDRIAQFGEFPWHLALQEKFDESSKYVCGASLLHPKVALTAAHCVHIRDPSKLIIRAGEWDTQTTNEPYPHSDYNVVQTLIHPGFHNKSMANDIALVLLSDPVKLSAHVNMICLPPQNFKFDSQRCVASGWGRDNFHDNNSYRVNLKKLELPIVSSKQCQERLRQTSLGDKFKLNPSFICAGGEKDVDTCVGDGGSALICGIPGFSEYYYQAGIVSWGIECGKEGIPGVYLNVAKFRDWIDAEMINLNFGSESYTL